MRILTHTQRRIVEITVEIIRLYEFVFVDVVVDVFLEFTDITTYADKYAYVYHSVVFYAHVSIQMIIFKRNQAESKLKIISPICDVNLLMT